MWLHNRTIQHKTQFLKSNVYGLCSPQPHTRWRTREGILLRKQFFFNSGTTLFAGSQPASVSPRLMSGPGLGQVGARQLPAAPVPCEAADAAKA